jgi:16S rRNA C967 or C1407 C5-methylase (RsmB/RsmF family)
VAKRKNVSFDDHYSQLFGERWPELRASLQQDPVHAELLSLPGCPGAQLLKPYFLDPASLAAAMALGVQPGDSVLDLCAAPGGKTLVLALALQGRGRLVSNERSATRRGRLRRVLEEHLSSDLRAPVEVQGHDATRWGLHEQGVYDRVLLDAPCSSERHVLNDPTHLAKWGPARSRHLAATQHAMLCAALDAVRVGGTILYSTCALAPLENDRVIDRLAKKRGDRFRVESIPHLCGEQSEHGLQVWPDRCQGQGPICMVCLTRSA